MMARLTGSGQDEMADGEAKAGAAGFTRWIVLLLCGLPVFWMAWIAVFAVLPGPGGGAVIEVVIPRASGLTRIGEILAEQGIVRDSSRFSMLALLTGKAKRLQAGEYALPTDQTPLQILALLATGKVLARPVTIPEGVDLPRIADILAADGWVEKDSFLALATDPVFIRGLGVQATTLEGYLFPDTYYLSRGQQDVRSIIGMMVARRNKVFAEICAGRPLPPGFSRHDVLTLASIVEKETAQASERPLIARVFLNRLEKGMRLQADPTVAYGRTDFQGRLTRRDLETNTPYNTYVIEGLPPGPIGNPGRAAIEAVLEPADAPYLFFVSKNDGTHFFSESLDEHNIAVGRYQKSGQDVSPESDCFSDCAGAEPITPQARK